MIKIIIEAEAKEIADLVAKLQSQPEKVNPIEVKIIDGEAHTPIRSLYARTRHYVRVADLQ